MAKRLHSLRVLTAGPRGPGGATGWGGRGGCGGAGSPGRSASGRGPTAERSPPPFLRLGFLVNSPFDQIFRNLTSEDLYFLFF